MNRTQIYSRSLNARAVYIHCIYTALLNAVASKFQTLANALGESRGKEGAENQPSALASVWNFEAIIAGDLENTLMMMVSTMAGVLVVLLLSVMTSSEATLCS